MKCRYSFILALLLALWLTLLTSVLVTGCATTPGGIAREQSLYRFGTNTVAFVQRDVAPYIPAPYVAPVEAFLALAGAGLAAWNLHQQKKLKELKNGQDELQASKSDKT